MHRKMKQKSSHFFIIKYINEIMNLQINGKNKNLIIFFMCSKQYKIMNQANVKRKKILDKSFKKPMQKSR